MRGDGGENKKKEGCCIVIVYLSQCCHCLSFLVLFLFIFPSVVIVYLS